MEKRKIIILGGGIGGLTAAHELAKHTIDFDITIIERRDHLGGQLANITDDPDENHMVTSWHSISNNFKYFLDILNEVVDKDNVKIIKHLKPFNKYVYNTVNKSYTEFTNKFLSEGERVFSYGFKRFFRESPTLKDRIILTYIYTYAQIICDERLEFYDKIPWKDYVDGLSPRVKRWILDSNGIILGVNYNELSTYFIFKIIRNRKKYTKIDLSDIFYTFDGSILDILFMPWRAYLENRGVKFLLNHDVTNIYHTDPLTTISSIDVTYKNKNHKIVTDVLTASIFINALDAKSIASLYPIENDFYKLYQNSRQMLTQVIFYLRPEFKFTKKDPRVLILPSTEWFLMVQIEEEIVGETTRKVLLCGIGMWDVAGSNGKKAINSTREEIAIECWYQINNTKHNFKFNKIIPSWNMVKSCQFDDNTHELVNNSPRYSNNVNTLNYRPHYKDSYFQNLYHANAYVKTNTSTYNIESAAEAGFMVSKIIYSKISSTNFDDVIITPVYFGEDKLSIPLQITRGIDNIIIKIGKALSIKNIKNLINKIKSQNKKNEN